MSYFYWIIGGSTYLDWLVGSAMIVALLSGMCWTSIQAGNNPTDQHIRTIANLLPPLTIGCCLLVLFLVPTAFPPPAVAIRALHYCGVALLSGFLVYGTACQLRIWKQIRAGDIEQVILSYRRWWAATRLVPAPAALIIMITGLRLTYEVSGMDVSQVSWLQWLIVFFAFFFFDGLTFYLPEICRMYRLVVIVGAQDGSLGRFHAIRDRNAEATLLLHGISLPFVLGLAIFRPQDLPLPFRFLSGYFVGRTVGESQLWRSLTLVGALGLLVVLLRARGIIQRNQYQANRKP